MNSNLIGLTGPSYFSNYCMEMIEEYYGCNFVLLYQQKEENIIEWLDKCDGIVISGGIDIHPSVYGMSMLNNSNLSKFDFKRDLKEIAIIKYALLKKIPLFAICRGHQLLSIVLGLKEDFIMDLTNSEVIHQPNSKNITTKECDVVHSIKILNKEKFPLKEQKERSLCENNNYFWVNSYHHQGIIYKQNNIYGSINVIATSEISTKREIIELMSGENWISCQWHPEYDWKENSVSLTVLEMYKKILEQI